MEKGNIKVIEPTDDYKRIHKSIIRNKNIDCETLGVYTKIVVLGGEWNLNIKGLSNILGLSDNKIRKSIGILEKEGYVKRIPIYSVNRLNGWSYEVYPQPLPESYRSKAGYATQSEEYGKCAETSLPQKQSTLKTVMTESGEDNNIRLNKHIDLINNKDYKKEKLKEKEKEFADRIYKLYPSKCPMRNTYLGKTMKDKERIIKLLKTYSMEEIERVVKREIENKYGKHYMQNFSTFLNNFPDPNTLFDDVEQNTSQDVNDQVVINGQIYR